MEDKKIMSPAVKGLMISLVLILIGVTFSILKQDTNQSLAFIPLAVMLLGIIWACVSYSNQMGNNVTFGNVFSHGFKASALVAGIMGLFVVLSLTVLFPEALDRGMEMQREAMEKKGMSESDIDQYMTMGRKMAVPMGTAISVVLYIVVGAISALIGAAIAKKNPNTNMPA